MPLLVALTFGCINNADHMLWHASSRLLKKTEVNTNTDIKCFLGDSMETLHLYAINLENGLKWKWCN